MFDNDFVEISNAKELALNVVKFLIDNNKVDNNRLLFSSIAIFKQSGCPKTLRPRLSSNEFLNGYYIREDMYGIISTINKIKSGETKFDANKPFNIKYIVDLKRDGNEKSKELCLTYYENLENDIKAIVIPAIEKFMEFNNE